MAADDCAILVGVARYIDSSRYPKLGGPVNDVAHMYDWLTSPNGGGVPPINIRTVTTSNDLLKLPDPPPDDFEFERWQPSKSKVEGDVFSLILDRKRTVIPRPGGRLYLYFSGHGFTNDRAEINSAALYTADAGGDSQPNVCGTLYAEAIRKLAAFGQIVLIMDCCRDVKVTSRYDLINLTDASAPNVEKVSVLSVYATPKGGKAQEGVVDPGGPTVGFLTHALLRSFKEIPPDILGRVSASALDNYMAMNWSQWFDGRVAPPKPRIIPSYSDQAPIYFASAQDLVDQEFSVATDANETREIWLQSAPPKRSSLASISAMISSDAIFWKRESIDSQVNIPLSAPDATGRKRFKLRLRPIGYEILFDDPAANTRTFTAGGICVDL